MTSEIRAIMKDLKKELVNAEQTADFIIIAEQFIKKLKGIE